MMVVSWRLTLVLLAVVPPVAIGAVIFGRKVKTLSKAFQDRLAEASATAEENLSNMRTVRCVHVKYDSVCFMSCRGTRSFHNEAKAKTQYAADIHRSYLVGSSLSLVYGVFNGGVSLVAQ